MQCCTSRKNIVALGILRHRTSTEEKGVIIMRTEKVMSVYNLQDEGKLAVVLDNVEGLVCEKIGTDFYNGKETARYHVAMDGVCTGGQLLGRIAQFVQENEGTKVRFCSPKKVGMEEVMRV